MLKVVKKISSLLCIAPLCPTSIKTAYSNYKLIKQYPSGAIVEDEDYFPYVIMENKKGNLALWDMCRATIVKGCIFNGEYLRLKPDYAFGLSEKWAKEQLIEDDLFDYAMDRPNRYL